MGGIGSSRWGGHTRRRLIGEGTLELPVSVLAPLAACEGQSECRLAWGNLLALRATLGELREDRSGATVPRLLELDDTHGARKGYIYLTGARAPFGGVRWWLCCPVCAQRRRGLYYATPATIAEVFGQPLRSLTSRLRCRECARLAYRSQRLSPLDRLEHRGCNIAARMGHGEQWYPNNAGSPPKPKRMRWRTWLAYNEQLDAVEYRRDRLWLGQVRRFLASAGRKSWGRK